MQSQEIDVLKTESKKLIDVKVSDYINLRLLEANERQASTRRGPSMRLDGHLSEDPLYSTPIHFPTPLDYKKKKRQLDRREGLG